MTDWDAKYEAHGFGLFGAEPNEYLRAITARPDFSARTALFLADGNGRNSAWLAGRGVRVCAVDLSPAAVRQARELDAGRRVAVERTCADLAVWSPPALYDAAFVFYLQCDAPTRLRAVRSAAAALAPGGWLAVEAFAKSQARFEMGPDSESNLYDLDELRDAAGGLDLVEALEGVVRLEEGTSHHGLARVVRFAARRHSD